AKSMLYDRVGFASGVARKLIDIGVRCVVAAGWAVDDTAATNFAKTFYAALLRGERFIDAVAHARRAARDSSGNTWAAYQCYGDLFAEAHAAAGEVSGAIRWYDAVLASTTGDCSIRAYEQRSNLRVRDAWAKVDAARRQATGATEGRGRGTARETARQRAQASKSLRQAIAKARRIIRAEDRSLARLRMIGETAERASLRGAAMKRL